MLIINIFDAETLFFFFRFYILDQKTSLRNMKFSTSGNYKIFDF